MAWLIFYCLAIGCTIGSLWFSVSTRGRAAGWVVVRIGLGVLIIPAVAQADAWIAEQAAEPQRIWLRMLVFAAGVLAAVLLLAHESWLERRPWWRRGGRSTTLLACSLAASVLIGLHFHRSAAPELSDGMLERQIRTAKAPTEEDEVFGVTDLGRDFPLLRFSTEEASADQAGDDPEALVDPLALVPEPYRLRVIIAHSEASPANCHGWVFTGGKFLVQSRYVDRILEDNDYHVVSQPRVGDLIIYRNEEQEPVHTGLVKAVGNDGFVLIESKWGALETFYHLPEDQVYSPNYNYYRSTRPNHLILLLLRPIPPATPPASPQVPITKSING
ncbi:MAG: hypothetical protein U0939_09770 [Pirellulales bacterium]